MYPHNYVCRRYGWLQAISDKIYELYIYTRIKTYIYTNIYEYVCEEYTGSLHSMIIAAVTLFVDQEKPYQHHPRLAYSPYNFSDIPVDSKLHPVQKIQQSRKSKHIFVFLSTNTQVVYFFFFFLSLLYKSSVFCIIFRATSAMWKHFQCQATNGVGKSAVWRGINVDWPKGLINDKENCFQTGDQFEKSSPPTTESPSRKRWKTTTTRREEKNKNVRIRIVR